MSAQDQNVNFSYGFQLRGERQVEHGLDSIVDRFARTGSLADAATLAVAKFGRVFEVGLPLALGAAVVGRAAEAVYDVGEEAIKTRDKIDRLTADPIGEMDTSAIESNLSEIGDELADLGTEHGQGYAQGFWSAFGEGFQKISYNAIAATLNNGPAWLRGSILGSEIALPSYDQATGQTTRLSDRARESLKEIESRDDKHQKRLQRRLDIDSYFSDKDESKPAIKLQRAYSEKVDATQNRIESQSKKDAAESELEAFKTSIADRHELTQQEIKRGVELEKKLNDTTSQLIADKETEVSDQKAINDLIREQARFHRGVSSHTRAEGGGGGYYSAVHAHADVTVGPSPGSSPSRSPSAPPAIGAGDVLRDFTNSVKGFTHSLDDAMPPQHNAAATPTF